MARFLMRVDAGEEAGDVRLARMAVLARALEKRGHTILIASRDSLERMPPLDPDWQFVPLPGDYDAVATLSVIRRQRVEMVVADLPSYEAGALAAWRDLAYLTVFDARQDVSLPADLLLTPPDAADEARQLVSAMERCLWQDQQAAA